MNGWFAWCFLGLLAIAAGVGRVAATFREYPDITASSPNGRFAVSAASLEGAPFGVEFSYECTDTTANRVLWKRSRWPDSSGQDANLYMEGPPIEIFVDDSGWVVIWAEWGWRDRPNAQLIAVDQAGSDRIRMELFHDVISEAESERYVTMTTAGPVWMGWARKYFTDGPDGKLFVVWTWWSRRIVLDLQAGALTEPDAELAAKLGRLERESVMADLRSAVQAIEGQREADDGGSAMWSGLTAAHAAAAMGLTEAVPLLHELERSDSLDSYGFRNGALGYEPGEGDVDPGEFAEYGMRRMVHFALRRLGARPQVFPCMRFYVKGEGPHGERLYLPPALQWPRTEKADEVAAGMKPEAVIALIGEPDRGSGDEWFYEMDVSPPYRLVVTWGPEGVTGTEERTPPFCHTEETDQPEFVLRG
jgi:hypothetical protein